MFKFHVTPFVDSADYFLCTSNPVHKVLVHTDSLNCKLYVLEVIGLHIFNEGFWLILVLFLWRTKDVDLGSSSWNSASTILLSWLSSFQWISWSLYTKFSDQRYVGIFLVSLFVFIFTPLLLPIQEHGRSIYGMTQFSISFFSFWCHNVLVVLKYIFHIPYGNITIFS